MESPLLRELQLFNEIRQVQLLKEKQAAKILAVSVAALRRWRREGRGPQFIHCERCVRYDLRSIEKFLELNSSANKKAADSPSAAQNQEVRNARASAQR
jgi:hypothetical protein